jgi:hypothetical protein
MTDEPKRLKAIINRLKELLKLHNICQECGCVFTSVSKGFYYGCECDDE